MKTKRFVYEYANWKLKELSRCGINAEYQQEAERNIKIVIVQCEYGYISIDECIRKISNPFITDKSGKIILHQEA